MCLLPGVYPYLINQIICKDSGSLTSTLTTGIPQGSGFGPFSLLSLQQVTLIVLLSPHLQSHEGSLHASLIDQTRYKPIT